MKYLGLHKLLVAIILIVWLIVEILLCGLFYILYVIWNFNIPHNLWLDTHSGISRWDYDEYADKNPKQTFLRRYKLIFIEILHND